MAVLDAGCADEAIVDLGCTCRLGFDRESSVLASWAADSLPQTSRYLLRDTIAMALYAIGKSEYDEGNVFVERGRPRREARDI